MGAADVISESARPLRPHRSIDHRKLPVHQAGALPAQQVVSAFDEQVERETAWAPHSHATHELLWNESGVSTAAVGNRVWTITPTLGVWIPAGLVHAATAAAGTWYRTNHFDVTRVPRLAQGVAVVQITPLLRLLFTRLTSPELSASSRGLTEKMVLDVIEPAPREITVTIPSAPLLQPIVEALRDDPGDRHSPGDWSRTLGVSTESA
ncbi:AraC family ligand binding domain-containing protein [Microbacterium binotii]|uniref:AraC-type arabinose-binding/dimerisation domain-containing protein n=1 Tax=Microbacterium binotii TaxID=462710 RepID=A0ABN3PFP6_9MICO